MQKSVSFKHKMYKSRRFSTRAILVIRNINYDHILFCCTFFGIFYFFLFKSVSFLYILKID